MTKDEIIRASQSSPHCFLYRDAVTNDWIDYSVTVRNSGMWYVKPVQTPPGQYSTQDQANQYRAYLCESLATALDHPDRLIAFRACLQAQYYAGRLQGMRECIGARYHDALLEARIRLEESFK